MLVTDCGSDVNTRRWRLTKFIIAQVIGIPGAIWCNFHIAPLMCLASMLAIPGSVIVMTTPSFDVGSASPYSLAARACLAIVANGTLWWLVFYNIDKDAHR
jgi:hypothetical protein